jgi:hypothetical protein
VARYLCGRLLPPLLLLLPPLPLPLLLLPPPELRGAEEEGCEPPPEDEGWDGAEGCDGAADGVEEGWDDERGGAEVVRGAAEAPEEDGRASIGALGVRLEGAAGALADGADRTNGAPGAELPLEIASEDFLSASPEFFCSAGAVEDPELAAGFALTNLCSRGSKTIPEEPRAAPGTPASPASERDTSNGGATETSGAPVKPRGGALTDLILPIPSTGRRTTTPPPAERVITP